MEPKSNGPNCRYCASSRRMIKHNNRGLCYNSPQSPHSCTVPPGVVQMIRESPPAADDFDIRCTASLGVV